MTKLIFKLSAYEHALIHKSSTREFLKHAAANPLISLMFEKCKNTIKDPDDFFQIIDFIELKTLMYNEMAYE